MADKLIFPIGFDLEAAVKEAQGNADKYLRQIESAMNRKPIVLKAEVDASKFQMFSRQFSNSIDGISAKLSQAQRLWNAMSFDVKFDADGNLSRRAQVVFDSFQQLTQASATMGQRLGEVNRSLAKSETETAKLITAEYDKRKRQIDEQIRLKERQAAAEERVRQGQLKGVNVGYIDTQKQVEAVRNLRLQYEAILPMLNAMAQKRVNIRIGIDKQFETEVNRINAEIARLRQSNLQIGSKGDVNAIQANLTAIRQLESELARINQQKIDIFNNNKIQGDLVRLRSEIASVFGELQTAERKLATDNSLNAALDAQSQKVLKLHSDIQKLDQQIAQLNAQGKMYNADGSFSSQAISILQQRIALTKQLEQEAVTGQQAQIKLEQQLREEKRKTEQETKNAAKEAERQAKAEAQARKQAIDAANAENKARQAAYNARVKQGKETQRILKAEENSIANITAKLQVQQQRLQSANLGSAKFNKIAEEVKRLTQELDKANKKMRDLTGATTTSATQQSAAVKQVNEAFKSQDGYVSRLIKRLAVYASFSYASQFLTNIREVTAQFELQRVSLGAIIQDQTKANALFSEIKSFALKSPVSILDLTKYTKQVAAYRIETDKLFDTTKRLADVSVGLGVDMGRIVLAYGQVKAASYLRAAEIRQFTEAGIPMLELLAEKFTELEGKMVSTEKVMDLVSKRAVSFSMVEDIFNDMTSAGGMFYNMQEKQGNTLYGLWAKLGDAASVMYDEIGNTDSVNASMKDTIQLMTDLMKNWRLVGREMLVVAGTFLLWKTNTALVAQNTALATKATNAYTVATTRLEMAQKRGATVSALSASYAKKSAVAYRAASISTNAWTAAQFRLIGAVNSLKAALLGNWITLTIAAVAAIGAAIYSAYEKANKLKNELKEIQDSGAAESAKTVFNFQRLANAALDAANGSKEQKDALDELKRTYKDIIPSEQLSLENLCKMREQGYEPLTAAIKEYIAQRTLQKEIDAITSNYTEDTIKKQRELRELFKRGSTYNFFKGAAWSPISGLDDDQISQVFANVEKIAQDKSKKWEDVWVEAIKGVTDVSEEAEVKIRSMFNNKKQNAQQTTYNNKMRDIVENTRAMVTETDAASKKMESQTGSLGKYKQVLDKTTKSLSNFRALWGDGTPVDTKSFLYNQMFNNASIKEWKDDIIEDLKDAGIEIKNDWFSIINKLNPKDSTTISAINFEPILASIDAAKDRLGDKYVPLKNAILKYQELYNGIVPTDATVSVIRKKFKEIADETGTGFIDKVKMNLMGADETLKDYQKKIKDTVEELADTIKSLNAALAVTPAVTLEYGSLLGELQDAQERKEFYDKILALLPSFDKSKGGKGGTKSDPRLNNLKEEISLTKKLYDEYKKLEKQIGATRAAEKIQEIYSNTIKTLQGRAKKYGFTFELPFADENLKANMQQFINKMKELQKLTDKKGKPLFPNIGKDIDEAVAQLEDVDFNSLQKALEKKLKELSDKISRTKTAREFYDKILSQTGDVDLATDVTMSVYGDTGEGLFDSMVEQIKNAFKTGNDELDTSIEAQIDFSIDTENQRINYEYLAEIYEYYQDQIIEKNRDTAQKIVSEGQKTAASNILTWEKELAKAKDYEEKRTDIINRETQRRAEIYKSNLPQEEKDRLAAQSRKKQDEDVAKVNFEEFTKSEDYIKIFENLDNTSTAALKRLREEMRKLIDTNKDLSPENMKTLVKAMEDIDEQISGRGFGNDMVQGVRDYIDALRDLKTARADLQTAQAEYDAQLPQLDADIKAAKDEEIAAQEALNSLKANQLATDEQIVAAELRLNNATTAVTNAEQAKAKAAEKVKKAEKEVTDQQDKQRKSTNKIFKDFQKVASEADQLANALGEIKDLLGISEDSAAGLVFDSAIDGLQMMSKAIGVVTTAQAIFNAVAESNPYIAIAAGVLAVGAAIGSWISGNKVRKANKEIERQQEILDQLEYTYGRLQKAAEKVFGSDSVRNNNQQLKNLQAQAVAYQKQLEAEKSKGKKADKDKIKEYEDAWRDTMDEIADMQRTLSEKFLGSDQASAARDFAKAWIDAYKEVGRAGAETTQAMKEQFQDMIENMVVEGAMAAVMQKALQPMFDMIDNMNEEDFYSESFWKKVADTAEKGATDADNGAQTLMKFLEQAGMSIKDISSEYTGIKRDVAGASEETMSNVATIGNTLMYYVSPIPGIAANVAIMRQIMESGNASVVTTTTAAGWTDWQQQAMDSYLAIQRNTADTVVECRRAAVAAENAVSQLQRVISTKGNTHGFNVWMKS